MSGRGRQRSGFSLIELIVVIAILGILLALGFVSLRRDAFQVREVARVVSGDFTRARSEAIRLNTNVGIRFTPTSYSIFVDANKDKTASGDLDGDGIADVNAVLLQRSLASNFPLAILSNINFSGDDTVWFDVRGLPRSAGGGFAAGSLTIVSRGDAETYREVILAPQGRVQIQAPGGS